MNADTNDIHRIAPAPVTPGPGRFDALWRVGSLVVFAVLPVVTLAAMLAVGLSDNSLAADFHHEIYPQAKQMLDGVNPYPPADFDPTAAPNFIWPPLVAYLLSPLTLLPLGAADFVLLLLPVTPATRNVLDARRLAAMRPDAWLPNYGRGELVVDADRVDAVKRHVIAGAVLDVFRTEPLPDDHPFWTTPGITVLPHFGGLHPTRDELVATLFVENLRRFRDGEPLRHVVDPARGE